MTIPDNDTVLLISRGGMGEAEPALQKKLIATYFQLLNENNIRPAAICFYAGGIHLAIEGSPVYESLRVLEQKGVRLILCSTCLNFYQLMDRPKVGIVGGMADIIEAQFRAGKVISL